MTKLKQFRRRNAGLRKAYAAGRSAREWQGNQAARRQALLVELSEAKSKVARVTTSPDFPVELNALAFETLLQLRCLEEKLTKLSSVGHASESVSDTRLGQVQQSAPAGRPLSARPLVAEARSGTSTNGAISKGAKQ